MFSISQKLGITLPALEAANPQVKAPTYLLNIGAVLQIPGSAAPTAPTTAPSKPISPAPNPSPGTYVVQPGESLYSISQKLGVTLAALQAANPQVKPPVFQLNIGDVLQIPGSAGSNTGKVTGPGNNSSPAPGTYVVQPGDSMYTIAQKLNVQLSALEAANPQVKGPSYLINVKDVLKIPAGK
jgi:LysM repeat protein